MAINKLDELLSGEEPEELQGNANFGFDALHLSRYAYEKAFRYAQLVMQGRIGSLEIGGFLTKPKDNPDRIARDAFLARDQEVGSSFYRVSAEDVSRAGKELAEQGQRIIGWWHSHGRLDTFHSPTDNENQMVLLNQISPSNYVTSSHERAYDGLQSRVEGNTLIFFSSDNPAVQFHLNLEEDNPEIVAQKLKIVEERRIGFAYSFVVNHHRWLSRRVPYCEIATRDICGNCINSKDQSVAVGYKIFDDREYTINDEQLLGEIEERVHVGHKKGKKNYFLPSTFQEKRSAGTLSEPNFGLESSFDTPPYGNYRKGSKRPWRRGK